MTELNFNAFLSSVMSSFIYGMLKAEAKITGKSNVLSRIAGEEYALKMVELVGQHGIEPVPATSAFEWVESYINFLYEAGLLPKDAFKIEKKDDTMSITACNCPYAPACTALLDEGFKTFGCAQIGALTALSKKAGNRLSSEVTVCPGQCTMIIRLWQ
ncbi:hypothetical protein JW964_12270 [candidate division KSB1 bacterium]|nr:hypothetical protein [candidate division KSB1 bacterium]